MEKVFYVQNRVTCYGLEESSELDEVNEILAKGGKVKMIHTTRNEGYDYIFAYIVIEMPEGKKQK